MTAASLAPEPPMRHAILIARELVVPVALLVLAVLLGVSILR